MCLQFDLCTLQKDLYNQHRKWNGEKETETKIHHRVSGNQFLNNYAVIMVFFIDSERNETIPLHFWNVFHFLTRKNPLRKTFLLERVRSGAQQATRKGGNFGAKLTHLCGFWLDVSFFFTCENHSSLLWVARTYLRIKIYNTTF